MCDRGRRGRQRVALAPHGRLGDDALKGLWDHVPVEALVLWHIYRWPWLVHRFGVAGPCLPIYLVMLSWIPHTCTPRLAHTESLALQRHLVDLSDRLGTRQGPPQVGRLKCAMAAPRSLGLGVAVKFSIVPSSAKRGLE